MGSRVVRFGLPKWAPGLVVCDGCGLYSEILSGGLGGALCPPCADEMYDRFTAKGHAMVVHEGRVEPWHG